jgi:hypothetical protein
MERCLYQKHCCHSTRMYLRATALIRTQGSKHVHALYININVYTYIHAYIRTHIHTCMSNITSSCSFDGLHVQSTLSHPPYLIRRRTAHVCLISLPFVPNVSSDTCNCVYLCVHFFQSVCLSLYDYICLHSCIVHECQKHNHAL